MNEILSNRATEILGGELGKYDLVTLEDVNLFQSANDVVPTAAKHSTIVIGKGLIVEAKKLLKAFQDKSLRPCGNPSFHHRTLFQTHQPS